MNDDKLNDHGAKSYTFPRAKVTNGLGSIGFAHRKNEDGSFDSICLKCFHTALSTHYESLLDALESQHHCSEADKWRSKMLKAEDHRWRDTPG